MAVISGLTELTSKLLRKKDEAKKEDGQGVTVGFTQNYAIYVHENTQAHHPVGQAKFLEEPARTMGPQFRALVHASISAGMPILQALLVVGLRLQREAQELCPVDTGALKASAFTATFAEENAKASEAFFKSVALQQRKKTQRAKKAAKTKERKVAKIKKQALKARIKQKKANLKFINKITGPKKGKGKKS